jgi:hypothetical protein
MLSKPRWSRGVAILSRAASLSTNGLEGFDEWIALASLAVGYGGVCTSTRPLLLGAGTFTSQLFLGRADNVGTTICYDNINVGLLMNQRLTTN